MCDANAPKERMKYESLMSIGTPPKPICWIRVNGEEHTFYSAYGMHGFFKDEEFYDVDKEDIEFERVYEEDSIKIEYINFPLFSFYDLLLDRPDPICSFSVEMCIQVHGCDVSSEIPQEIRELISHVHRRGPFIPNPLGIKLTINGEEYRTVDGKLSKCNETYALTQEIYEIKYQHQFLTCTFKMKWNDIEKLFSKRDWFGEGVLIFNVPRKIEE